jgi:nucleotide-binding universal stress UspA family protein
LSSIKSRISRILVPLDDSQPATNAADCALLISKGLNAEVIAIHVVRTEDALIATNLGAITTEDLTLQKVK